MLAVRGKLTHLLNSGAAEPGDADYGAPDTAVVGCVPGLTGASTGSVPRKQRRKA